jgi:tyrosine-protein phosphatase SIW14
MIQNSLRAVASFLALVIGFTVVSNAQSVPTAPSEFQNVKIRNFGQMDERYFRGAQPEPGDYQALKDLGVNTVIDLRNDPTHYEKAEVEALGMRYVNIPFSGWKYAKDTQVEEFMKIMNDPSTGIVFAHCKAGKHRTGLTGAVYRMEKYGWDYDTAYKEMKNYEYTSWPVHFNIKAYVRDYAERIEKERRAAARSVAAVPARMASN